MPPVSFVLIARKGGVGRTTNAINLAGAYAQSGVNVLLVDLDGQASLSRTLLGPSEVDALRPQETVAAVFQGEHSDIIRPTNFANISLMPSGDALEPLATPVKRDFARDQFLLRDYLKHAAREFDLVIIDTPPHTNVSSVWAALCASHYVLSPVPADAFGVQSISSILSLVASVQTMANPNLLVLGYVISMLQRNSVNNAYCQTLRRLHGSQVFTTEIPFAAAYKEAVAARTPITHAKPKNKASTIIRELANEIQNRLEALHGKEAA